MLHMRSRRRRHAYAPTAPSADMKRGNVGKAETSTVQVDRGSEFQAFDRLPRSLRDYLNEAPVPFSSDQVADLLEWSDVSSVRQRLQAEARRHHVGPR